MREIIEWLCPVCGSEDVLFRESECWCGECWLCTNCGSMIPGDIMYAIERARRRVKQNEAKKKKNK